MYLVDVTSVINTNVKTLSFEELLELAVNRFTLSDYYEYDYGGYIGFLGEELACKVNVSEVAYGLTRVKVPNTDESYYYVPAMIFYGDVQFTELSSGMVYDVETESGRSLPLLILNAIDGSVINSTNE